MPGNHADRHRSKGRSLGAVEWWPQMFGSPLWQGIQLAWEEADDADADAAQVARALDLRPRSQVLDVPCGTGRIARRLHAAGHRVVGVDATARFLMQARRADLPVIQGDMRTILVRPSTFDAAFCLWGSFGYFDDAGNRAQAGAMADALLPGGRCLVDTLVADNLLPRFAPADAWQVGGVRVEEARRYDETSGRIETTWTFTSGDARARQVTSVRLYSLAELTDLFAEAGFSSFQAFDGELAPFQETSLRLWLVATTPG
jgi:SAM-dependent methyltransferase